MNWDRLVKLARELGRIPGLLRDCEENLREDRDLADERNRHVGIHDILTIELARQNLREHGGLDLTLLLRFTDWRLCTDPRDRVNGILGLVTQNLRERIQVSYDGFAQDKFEQVYIDCTKACIQEEGIHILQLCAGRQRRPGLPTWCPNIHSPSMIRGYLPKSNAGVSSDSPPPAPQPFFSEDSMNNSSNILCVPGFQVDAVCSMVADTIHWNRSGDLTTLASKTFGWISRCRQLAHDTCFNVLEDVDLIHVYTLAAGDSLASPQDLYEAYVTNVENLKRKTQNQDMIPVSEEKSALYYATWGQIVNKCEGRVYFGTGGGRVGIGPPDMKVGDKVCVLYGASPLYILRPLVGKENGYMLIGNAYIHGLMELDKTPIEVRGPDETFRIF
jgi:hypothetical protein